MKAIFFDFDGTLADTAEGIVLTMQQTFLEMGYNKPSDEAIRQTIGLPLIESIRNLGNFDQTEAERGTEVYRRLFQVYEADHVFLFPEVNNTLSQLQQQGIRMAICTSRTGYTLDMMLERFGIAQFFETKVSCNDGLSPKPAPDMVLELLKRMDISANEVAVVGDTTFDIEMGNRAGCYTLAVTYGNHTLAQLLEAQPNFTADSFSQILNLLNSENQ